jgi:hypothetical protein
VQILLLPLLQSVVMAIPCFQLAEPSGVGHFAAIAMFNSQVMVKHLVVNDTHDHILWHVALIQGRMDADCFGSVRVAGKLNGILLPDPPVGSPGDRAVNLVFEVFRIDLVKQIIEIEEAPLRTHYSLPGLTRRSLYLI